MVEVRNSRSNVQFCADSQPVQVIFNANIENKNPNSWELEVGIPSSFFHFCLSISLGR